MSRLPQLERALVEAAERLDGRTVPTASRHARRWRRRGTPLLAVLASVVIAGGALATATALLDDGDPVPADRSLPIAPADPTTGFRLAAVRAPDPEGGPPWGVGTYPALIGSRRTQRDATRRSRAAILCIVVGRVQNGRLGVIGRDGVFDDDGRFHPLAPATQSSNACAARTRDGTFVMYTSMPPIPASGYTGAPGTKIGGCRERVDLDGPTVSAQTRRRLRHVPQCRADSLRLVLAGFAGPEAKTATLTAPGYRKTLELRAEENSPYLFVTVLPRHPSDARLSITYRDGQICDPLLSDPCPGRARGRP